MSTITKEFTKEQLQQIIETDHVQCGEASALARIALASLEAEPVAEVYQPPNVGICAALGVSVRMLKTLRAGDKLFTAPPAPVSVPDEVCWEDVPEEITEDDMALASAWAHGFNQCRAAMLKHSEPFIVTSDHRMMEMPQVEAINAVTAMLQGVENVKSRCTIQTAPALDSLTKNAESRCGNSPVIPDDVRRMDWLVSKTVDVREPMVYGSHSLFWSQTITDEEDDYHATKLREQIDAAMAAEQAAAPQQEAE